MPYNSRSPIPVSAQPAHPLRQMRSEGQLKATPERTLHRLQAMGQLSKPPDWPLPPVPPRSPLRPLDRARDVLGIAVPSNHTADKHSRFSTSNSSSPSSSHYSEDDEADANRHSGRNTMLIQNEPNEKKIEFTLRRTSKQTPSQDDLSQILHLRGRLQEMGTKFTAEGEMQTYGNPSLNADLEQMLRLGSMYDEQWNILFGSSNTHEADSNLWPDLKVLKKMLQNDGVLFDDQHQRLNYGTSHPRLIRLSDQYDVLREEWIEETIRDIHPAEREQRPCSTQEEVPKAPTNLGWSFLLDNDGEDELVRRKSLRSSRLTIAVEEQLSIRNGTTTTVQDAYTAYSSPPIIPESLASARDITPILASDTTTTTRPHGPTIGASTLLHSSSSLQAAETSSMLLRDAASETRSISTMSEVDAVNRYHEQRQHEHAGVLALLVEDERRRVEGRQRAEEPVVRERKKKTKKRKGVWKWLRAMLGRRKEAEQ